MESDLQRATCYVLRARVRVRAGACFLIEGCVDGGDMVSNTPKIRAIAAYDAAVANFHDGLSKATNKFSEGGFLSWIVPDLARPSAAFDKFLMSDFKGCWTDERHLDAEAKRALEIGPHAVRGAVFSGAFARFLDKVDKKAAEAKAGDKRRRDGADADEHDADAGGADADADAEAADDDGDLCEGSSEDEDEDEDDL